MLGIFKFGIE